VTTGSRSPRLAADDWIRAALAALAEGGLTAISVEPLARGLGATKGSFYWHFANREALVDATLLAWEQGETTAVAQLLAPLPDAATRLRVLMRAALDDRPGARVEAALLADAGVPNVRAVLDRATRARTAYLGHLFDDLGCEAPADRATTAFALYLGLLHLRRAGSGLAPRGKELDAYVEHLCVWLTDGAAPASDRASGPPQQT
jgi:AcrR family transcriptional regulator